MNCHRTLQIRRIRLNSTREVAAAVDVGKDAQEEADGGQQEDQNAVAQRFADGRSGSCSRLIAHRAALRDRVRHRHSEQQ